MDLDCHLFYTFLGCLVVQNFGKTFGMKTLIYKEEKHLQSVLKKLRKHELDLKFLVTACDTRVYPKFTCWKNVKNSRVLLDEIHNKHQSVKQLRKDLTTSMENLSSATTLFKSMILRISINRSVLKDEKMIIKHHQKKLQSLLDGKNKENNIQANPNPVVTNLSNHVPTNEEHSILKFGLKHGLATRPNQSSIFAYAEDIWEQIDRANICHNEIYSKLKIKNSLCGLAFNLINIDDTQIYKDQQKSSRNCVNMSLF